jgi:CoA-transferase family III
VAAEELQYARQYAQRLLADLDVAADVNVQVADSDPALRWARSGNMALTGYAHAAAQMCPVPLASLADGLIGALAALSGVAALQELGGAQLLAERAALSGYRRAGQSAPGGSCRWLRAADGWLALNLARDSDWELLPAWLETAPTRDWDQVAALLISRTSTAAVERGRLLGLPVAPLASAPGRPVPWYREHLSVNAVRRAWAAPLVVDLSSLWAGPLCTHLLQLMGARVIKVESSARPDGMRDAGTGFFDLLNAGKESVALDFGEPRARAQLRGLLSRADIVIEASRPRALRQLGIVAEELLAQSPRLTWISISGYGREEPQAGWVAFGDDGAVAGGLSQVMWECTGQPMFCGDAIADPLTGLHAALAAWSAHLRGGGRLRSLCLCDVVAHGVQFGAAESAAALRARAIEWSRRVAPDDIAPPRCRPVTAAARPLGADTQAVLAELKL